MSDISDVQDALCGAIESAVYPNGTGSASVSSNPIVIYAGWPTASRLDADLLVDKAHITVFPTPMEKNVTRYQKDWELLSVNAATITATINGQTITIGGAMPAPFTPHNVMAMVNHKPYVYTVLNTDTLATIAAALAALIAVDVPTTSAVGAVITCPASANITVTRIGVTGTSIRELRRQERVFQITVWANTPDQRDVIGSAVDVALAATDFLEMPDGCQARLVYKSSMVVDNLQKANLYRRDFNYSVEYSTTQTQTDTQVSQGSTGLSMKNDGSIQYTDVITTNF